MPENYVFISVKFWPKSARLVPDFVSLIERALKVGIAPPALIIQFKQAVWPGAFPYTVMGAAPIWMNKAKLLKNPVDVKPSPDTPCSGCTLDRRAQANV